MYVYIQDKLLIAIHIYHTYMYGYIHINIAIYMYIPYMYIYKYTGQVADSNSTRLEWIVIWLISIEIILGIASNPLFAGRRVLVSLLVPLGIGAYKKINWSNIFK
jgi:hypothetical protein